MGGAANLGRSRDGGLDVVTQCVSEQFRVVSGVLDLQAMSVRRMVYQSVLTPQSGGTFTTERPLPGVNHFNSTVAWTSNVQFPLLVTPELTSMGALIRSPQPNLVFLRTRATVSVGGTPAAPDLAAEFDSEFGGGFDISSQNKDETPLSGSLFRATAVWTMRKDPAVLNPGETIRMSVRMASYTPPPWTNNADANSNTHQASPSSLIARFWAAPTGTAT